MRDWSWILHHIPYVAIGIVSLYLITEPGRQQTAPFVLYLLFLPLPLFLSFKVSRKRRK